ncbi:MAG: aldehyde dehydrogenase family protein [Candidatus Wallbacteria bacterium]|nr:aldehyde dehydrogenase family protein [Candidatus Wallbacteria bacterium]
MAGKELAAKLSPVDGKPIAEFCQAAGLGGRREALSRLRRLLVERRGAIVATITRETGKPLVESYFEVVEALECLKFMPARAAKLLRERRVVLKQPTFFLKKVRQVWEPYGVVGLISPWNFPFSIPMGELLQALAAGNTVVFKPSEWTPFTGLLLGRLLTDAGLPPGVVNVVTGDGRTGAALVAAAIDKVAFTGSVPTGLAIGRAAAERGIPASMELGGKDPAIVRADADLATAPEGVLWGAVMNCGQGCSAVERVYVERGIHDAFVERLAAACKRLVVGDGAEPATSVGPLINPAQRAKVCAQIEDAVHRGARVVCGGEAPARLAASGGWFLEPTVLANVDHTMAVMREETFGPVVPVMAYAGEDEAVRLANDCVYGLGASIWTRDLAGAEALARRLRAGNVWVNDVLFSHAAPETTWGGTGLSGHGYTHGDAGLLTYVHPKWISIDGSTAPKDGWYPYGPERREFADAVVELLYGHDLLKRARAIPRALRGMR